MKIGIHILRSVLVSKLTQKKNPLAISWVLTRRCNRNCLYCGVNSGAEEISTNAVIDIINQLYTQGVRFVSFTGGEPLLRSDIGTIINYVNDKGMSVKINTNGFILEEKINEVKDAKSIQLSLDGREDINDYLRGESSYKRALKGLVAAKEKNIKVIINTVISKYNVHDLKDILDICKSYDVKVVFQPSFLNILGTDKLNPTYPDFGEYRAAILELIFLKKSSRQFNALILNSVTGLHYLYNWPNARFIPCYAGITNFRIDDKGRLYSCNEFKEEGVDILQYGFKEALKKLRCSSCGKCWCGLHAELNFVMDLNFNAVLNVFKTDS